MRQVVAETVVSHNTIVSGQLPKHMGWSDELLRDADGVLYDKGSVVTVGVLTYEQYAALIDARGYPKLGDYLHEAFPDPVAANFGGKYYQVASTAASSSDILVTYGSKKDVDPAWGLPWTGKHRGPSGGNVPSYITGDGRFKISTGNRAAAGNDYRGTDADRPAYLCPEDGRMVPGPYETELGGDDRIADCAIKVIENEDWSALHLDFSGSDKIGHLWGGGSVDTIADCGWDPDSLMKQVHMPWIARNADDQVGRVIRALKENGGWASTLFVVLAAHGATWAENARCVDTAGGGNDSWYHDQNDTCADTDCGAGIAPNLNNDAVLTPLIATGNLALSSQSTAIEAWLIDDSWAEKTEEAQAMKAMPGVVGLLKGHTSYGVYGDHGGAQKEIQRVPMVFSAEG